MSVISFGEYMDGKEFKVLDERSMRASAGIMFLFGLVASINGFMLQNFDVIPYFSGFLVINFLVGIFFNPKFSPTVLLSNLFIRNQSPLPIGAIQKKFAWSLGLMLSGSIFVLSLLTLKDSSYFEPVCFLCIICLVLLYLETAFGICVGCKIYLLAIKAKLLPKPTAKTKLYG